MASDAEAATAPSSPPIAPRLPAVDRYALLEELGRGGMGVVYAAYDTQLDRRVALKLVSDQLLGNAYQDRLRREARALAQLSHPNVVPVFDVGELAGRVYFTMEFVRGRTAAAWATEPRTVEEILALGRAAAAGLAAAHAIGLVHRDVKPGNILVGDDGRVRVADFGVAREATVTAREDGALATTTAIVGSPAYMAPEQLRGDPLDARCDQFALSVALFELLHGERPFAGATVDARLAAIEAGPPAPVRSVPGWVTAAIARGLAASPDARHRDMNALASALSPPRRRRAPVIAGAAIALAGGAVALALLGGRASAASACEALSGPIDDVWSITRRTELVARLGGDANALHLAEQIDDYAARWRGRRTDACVAARVDRTWSSDLEARAVRCLDLRRHSLDTMLTAVTAPGPAPSANQARDAFSQLATPLPCSDPDYLRSTLDVAAPVSQSPVVRVLDDELAALDLDIVLGRPSRAAHALPALRDQLKAVGDRTGLAYATLLEGNLVMDRDLASGIRLHAAAYAAARAARSPNVATKAAVALVWDLGTRSEQHARAEDWALVATAEASSLEDHEVGVILHYAQGALADRNGETTRALDEFTRAAEIARRELGEDHLITAKMLSAQAGLLAATGNPGALRVQRQAVAALERWMGPDSPRLAAELGNLALTEADAGELAQAEVDVRRAHALAQSGASAEIRATEEHNVGTVLLDAGRRGEAAEWFVRVAQLFASEHSDGAAATSRLFRAVALVPDAVARHDTAQLADLHSELVAARAELVTAFGPDDATIADADLGLGELLARQGRCPEAAPLFTRAEALQDKINTEASQRKLARDARALCP